MSANLEEMLRIAQAATQTPRTCRTLRQQQEWQMAQQRWRDTFNPRTAEALVKVAMAADALKFAAYPAHGSGHVLIVADGNVDNLADALSALTAAMEDQTDA